MIRHCYVHIPFCSSICSYCDFPKMLYEKKFINSYLDSLKYEINSKYSGDILDTLYIGGGTPSVLSIDELEVLFKILKIFKLSDNYEFTVECNLENLTLDKLKLFKRYGVNRLSIGVQTFNKKYLDFLNRKTCDTSIIKSAKKLGFDNINVDLIYAIDGETLDELNSDIDKFLSLGINHISTYSLIIENNTVLSIKNIKPIDEDIDFDMYNLICKKLSDNGYNHYEISNFAKDGYESRHNLSYWNNLEYYGFGFGAAGYINKTRYNNTKSIFKYINHNYIYEIEELDKKSIMEYEMILGLRKIKGVDMALFKDKYGISINEAFKISELLEKGKLIIENGFIRINPRYLYVSNDILVSFIGDV